ncbi:hypothetical protein ABPG72_002299 [Tetrahymena utriculariae]
MENEYAFAKLQNLNQEEFFIRQIPLILRRKSQKEIQKPGITIKEYPATLAIGNCAEIKDQHAILFYSLKKKCFSMIAFDLLSVDNLQANVFKDAQFLLNELKKANNLDFFDKYEEYTIYLNNFSQIYIGCDKCEVPHLYVLVLPASQVQKNESLNLKASSVFSHAQNQSNPNNKQHDKTLYQKWSADDREQLKKCIINYGYGRWKQIQRSSTSIGGKLAERPKSEIRAFANAFIRSLAEQLTSQNAELKQFLYNMIDEYPDDSYITPCDKDWDTLTLNQRAIPFTKRLQLLYRIRVLIKKYKDDQLKSIPDKDKDKINWEGLLNFLPNSLLYGQRPSVWWTKKHDTDLLRGVYKYGYANYPTIRHAKEYCFSELEKIANVYQNFPTSDALTRRLKKLIQTILKSEEDKGKIDFDMSASSDDEEKGWSVDEKEILFNYLMDNGVPLNNDGRSNWVEIREKMKLAYNENQKNRVTTNQNEVKEENTIKEEEIQNGESANKLKEEKQNGQVKEEVILESSKQEIVQKEGSEQMQIEEKKEEESKDVKQEETSKKAQSKEFDKSISQIEKMVQRIRVKCQELIVQCQTEKGEEEQNISIIEEDKDEDGFTITLENARKFNQKTNMLHFIRKTVLSNNQQLFNSNIDELQKRHESLTIDDQGFIDHPDYIPKVHDLNLMFLVSNNGFSSLQNLDNFENYQLKQFNLDDQKLYERLEWLCECFKDIKDKTQNKKRKADKQITFKDQLTKKPKFEINRDENGKIIFPIQINTSLKLLATGEINLLPTYHSEHNLFPVGFKSVRVHASIFHKGVRCEYTNEILEGPEGKPLYRVTSAEDPDNPIVKESSTGCWVHICQRVNELQDVKKEKVTISGTERFGLLETNVIRLLEDLQNSEKCAKYKFKFKNINRSNEELD